MTRYVIYLFFKRDQVWFPLSTTHEILEIALSRQQFYEYRMGTPAKIERVNV